MYGDTAPQNGDTNGIRAGNGDANGIRAGNGDANGDSTENGDTMATRVLFATSVSATVVNMSYEEDSPPNSENVVRTGELMQHVMTEEDALSTP